MNLGEGKNMFKIYLNEIFYFVAGFLCVTALGYPGNYIHLYVHTYKLHT